MLLGCGRVAGGGDERVAGRLGGADQRGDDPGPDHAELTGVGGGGEGPAAAQRVEVGLGHRPAAVDDLVGHRGAGDEAAPSGLRRRWPRPRSWPARRRPPRCRPGRQRRDRRRRRPARRAGGEGVGPCVPPCPAPRTCILDPRNSTSVIGVAPWPSPRDGHGHDAPHEGRLPERRIERLEAQVGAAPHQGGQRHFELLAGQGVAEAVVGPAPEGHEVALHRAAQIEAVGVGEDLGVTVGGPHPGHHDLALGDLDAAEGGRHRRHPGRGLARSVVAEQLPYGVGHELRFGLEQGELVGVAVQGQHGQARPAGGGLVAGQVEEDGVGDELLLGEPLTLLLGVDHGAEEIVVGIGAALGGEAGEVLAQHAGGLVGLGQHLVGHREELEDGVEGVDPFGDAAVVVVGDAEQLADDPHRELVGIVGHQVHLPVGGDRVDEVVGDGLDPLVHLADAAGGERGREQLADPAVIGVVEDEDHVGEQLEVGLFGDTLAEALDLRADVAVLQRPVGEEGGRVGVAGEEPVAERPEVHRVPPAQLVVLRVGVDRHLRCQRVEEELVVSHGCPLALPYAWPFRCRSPSSPALAH